MYLSLTISIHPGHIFILIYHGFFGLEDKITERGNLVPYSIYPSRPTKNEKRKKKCTSRANRASKQRKANVLCCNKLLPESICQEIRKQRVLPKIAEFEERRFSFFLLKERIEKTFPTIIGIMNPMTQSEYLDALL